MVKLAGSETVGTSTPTQLYAGEADIVTTQGTVKAGTAAMAEHTVVAEVAGYLVPYNKEGADGSETPAGVLPHAIDASASAADLDTPWIIGGVLNFEALVADGQTYAALRAAFREANSNVVIQKLY
jgi:hypothetical protein